MNDKRGPSLTYAQAGVDIDAGNRMVDLIRVSYAGELALG